MCTLSLLSRLKIFLVPIVITVTLLLYWRFSVPQLTYPLDGRVMCAPYEEPLDAQSKCLKLCQNRFQRNRLVFSPLRRNGLLQWHWICIECNVDIVHGNKTLLQRMINILISAFKKLPAQIENNGGSGVANIMHICTVAMEGNSKDVKHCYAVLQDYVKIGPMPVEMVHAKDSNSSGEENNQGGLINPVYVHNPTLENNSTYNETNFPCPILSGKRKKMLYRTLQEWIKLAYQYQLMWWICYGSLLGSLRRTIYSCCHMDISDFRQLRRENRDGTIIPYDHDMDICILGSHVDRVRKLATDRRDIKIGQFNLVTRPAGDCRLSGGARMTCDGRKASKQVDTCSFCGPLARMFYRYGTFIDIFVTHLQFINDSHDNSLRFGYFDEGWQAHNHGKKVMSLDHIFPLKICLFMGLTVPCPRKVDAITVHYGKNFMIPKRRCNITSKTWVTHS
ncbi:unnamed protein product [Calicophoron daubneyi]|uniref:Uncharacterized protein n=1 Tax=Calicophoron daubneyi TaxID=300641 RepID=A0AAV2TBE4_CALDB